MIFAREVAQMSWIYFTGSSGDGASGKHSGQGKSVKESKKEHNGATEKKKMTDWNLQSVTFKMYLFFRSTAH